MKRFLLTIIVIFSTILSCFGQNYNSKGGSHKGYLNPRMQQQRPTAWSGSGIAISDNIFATNHHVVDGATNLVIYLPETKEQYKSKVLITDAINDLALVKIIDSSFTGFPPIKYGFKKAPEDVGMGVFVLGYPLVNTMGEEIKLTTGVVSSRSGYQGNPSQYQISAPVQPGNSGGPLFNDYGELIGIVSAKHSEADNVSYGVKLSYLFDLVSRSGVSIPLDKTSQISQLSLSEKCKVVIPFTIMVLANNFDTATFAEQYAPQQPKSVPEASTEYSIHVNSPKISKKEDNSINIYGIEITPEKTTIYVSYNNTQNSERWYNIDKDTYILDKSTGKKYKLLSTENCAIAPAKSKINQGCTEDIVLYFQALPASVETIDLCEPSNWSCYGINVK